MFVVQRLATLPDASSLATVTYGLRVLTARLVVVLAHDDCEIPSMLPDLAGVTDPLRSLLATVRETAHELPGPDETVAARLLAGAAAHALREEEPSWSCVVLAAVLHTDGSVELPYSCHAACA